MGHIKKLLIIIDIISKCPCSEKNSKKYIILKKLEIMDKFNLLVTSKIVEKDSPICELTKSPASIGTRKNICITNPNINPIKIS